MASQGAQAPASFVSKPSRGWLHPDHLFARDGINYAVRYLGYVEVNTSMKVLDFDTRSSIAKECIHRVCHASGASTIGNRKPGERKIVSMLGDRATLARASTNVQLTITSTCLKLSDLDSARVLHQHEMPNISFASGGDSDTLDFIAYVAKDSAGNRACYVLECGGGLAQDVITTVGQAFELRFKEFLKKTGARPPPLVAPLRLLDDPEYYNDLPMKGAPGTQVNKNLIDLSSEQGQAGRPEYVNTDTDGRQARTRDPFDMSPFALAPPGGGIANILSPVTPLPPTSQPFTNQSCQLVQEEWFHGPISRKEAEQLLRNDGDFLVRESQGSSGQFVLTGMQGEGRKHLLLVDPLGVVRTKDRTFDSVSHLIEFHRNNKLPIISAESALRLETPVAAMVGPGRIWK